MRDSGPVPARVRISTRDMPRWSAVRDYLRQELQSRPSIHQVKSASDSRIMGEMLLIVAQQRRIPDPNIHLHDTEAEYHAGRVLGVNAAHLGAWEPGVGYG